VKSIVDAGSTVLYYAEEIPSYYYYTFYPLTAVSKTMVATLKRGN